jgi:hypothetical protein
MTEAEWLGATDPAEMLTFLRGTGKATDRKLRLFAVACCRGIWPLLLDKRSRQAVDVAERFADGEAGLEELKRVLVAAYQARDGQRESSGSPITSAAYVALETCRAGVPLRLEVTLLEAVRAATHHLPRSDRDSRRNAQTQERAYQAALLRELFGPLPFRELPPLPAYNDATVQRLAQTAYDDRVLPSGHLDPTRLAVLADALLDAGYPADAEILQHLRGEGPHWRGCWALDAVMGKS